MSTWVFFVVSMGALGWMLAETAGAMLASVVAAREEFEGIFADSPVPLLITALDPASGLSSLLEMNAAAERKLGISRELCVGRGRGATPYELGLTPEAFAELDAAIRDRRAHDLGVVEVRRRGLPPLRAVISARPATWKGLPATLWTAEDVTQLEAAKAGLESANRDLEVRIAERGAQLAEARAEMVKSETMASLGSMVSSISHELNTPIGNALLAASSMRSDVAELSGKIGGGAIRRSDLERYVERAARASAIVEENLARGGELLGRFKQSAADRDSMTRRKFDLRECSSDALDLLRPSISRAKAKIDARVEPGAPVEMDSHPGAVGQIVTNLVNNAVLHAFDGRESGSILLRVWSEGEWAFVAVEDDGPGVSESARERVFEKFFSTKLGQGGTGLGLTISSELARSPLGGELALAAEPSSLGGARFLLRAPRRAPAPKSA